MEHKSTRFVEGDFVSESAPRKSSHKKKRGHAEAVYKGTAGNLLSYVVPNYNVPRPVAATSVLKIGQICMAANPRTGRHQCCKVVKIAWEMVCGVTRPLYSLESAIDKQTWKTAFVVVLQPQ